jgi:hypothetical protein
MDERRTMPDLAAPLLPPPAEVRPPSPGSSSVDKKRREISRVMGPMLRFCQYYFSDNLKLNIAFKKLANLCRKMGKIAQKF